MELYDLLIVGGGAAGLAAGVYGGRARLNTAILEKGAVGGTAFSTRELANYPGFHADGVSGPFLMEEMANHAQKFGTQILRENVVDMDLDGEIKIVKGKKGKEYGAKALILALGTEPRLLGLPGELEYRGSGVSYCATCDAENYKNGVVVVLGNGDAAIEEAMYIAKFAEKVVIIVIHDEGVVDCNRISAEKAFAHPKLEFVWNSTLAEVKGNGDDATSVIIRNLKTEEKTELQVDGVFFYVGLVPQTDSVKGKLDMTPQGYIPTNDKMETSVPGVYAVGDCRVKYLRQVVTATADGAIAAVAAQKYLEEMEEHQKILQTDKQVLLAFWSPANEFSINALAKAEPILAESQDIVKFVKVDLYRKQMLAQKYKVQAPGTFVRIHKDATYDVLSSDSLQIIENTLQNWLEQFIFEKV